MLIQYLGRFLPAALLDRLTIGLLRKKGHVALIAIIPSAVETFDGGCALFSVMDHWRECASCILDMESRIF